MNPSSKWKRLLFTVLSLAATAAPALAQHSFDGNILFDNYRTGVLRNLYPGSAQTLALYNAFAHNDSIDPQLGDPYNKTAPNWIPANGSPAWAGNDDVVNPVVHARECDNESCTNQANWAAIEPVAWRGAIAPALGPGFGIPNPPDWYSGWIYNNDTGLNRTDIDYGKTLIILQGDLVSNQTLVRANNYLLRGRVNVVDGVTLTIQAGTVIFGEQSTLGFLVIERGGKIMAQGTAALPIVFTSDQTPGTMAAGDFGGLVLNGRAIANCADCLGGGTCISEGTESNHCGTNDCDDSGILRYVRVEYAGHELSPNNELNAFTFNSVGSMTRVEYLNSFRGLDDLFEWFGGKVTCKYLIGQGGGDDGLDWQMGFRGYIQFAIIQQWGDGGSDKGIEADNNEFNYDAPCRSNPVLSNITLTCVDHLAGTNTNGINLRRGTDAQIYNSIVVGWKDTGLRVQDAQTTARGYFPDSGVLAGVGDVPPTQVVSAFSVRTLNPVGDRAMFFVSIPHDGPTSLRVFDLNGRLVHANTENLRAGLQTLEWNPRESGAVAGTYYYQVENQGLTSSGSLVTIH